MNLVCVHHQEAKRQQEAVGVVPRPHLLWRECEESVDCHQQRSNDDQAVVSICLNEVMPCDGQRVYMMLTKRTDECLQEEKFEHSTTIVCLGSSDSF